MEYNTLNDEEIVNYEAKEKRNFFNLNIRLGVNFSSLEIEVTGQSRNYVVDFGSQVNFRFGLEAELILGFNKNKWSIIFEPTYQSYNADTLNNVTEFKTTYKSIEAPIGVRYYMFLNDQSKFFVNGQFCMDFSFNSIIERNNSTDLDIFDSLNFCFGLGYKYNDRFSLEARSYTKRNVLNGYYFWIGDYNTFSVILGYTLF